MTNIFIIIMGIFITLIPRYAFTQETPPVKVEGEIQKSEPSFSLSDSDFNSVRNPFMEQIPRPMEPGATLPPVPNPITTVTTPQSNPTVVTTPHSGETPSNLQSGSTSAYKPVKTNKSVQIKFPNFTISGLIWDTDKPQAIINNKIVSVGDSVEDSIIVNISQSGVEVLREGKKFKILYK